MLDDESKAEGESGGDAPNPQSDSERDNRDDGVASCQEQSMFGAVQPAALSDGRSRRHKAARWPKRNRRSGQWPEVARKVSAPVPQHS
jgi:hypothetical protein